MADRKRNNKNPSGNSPSHLASHHYPKQNLNNKPEQKPDTVEGSGLISGSEGSHIGRFFQRSHGSAIAAEQYATVLKRADLLDGGDPAVYIHLPFCPSRCLSCDHITSVTHDGDVIAAYLDDLDRELEIAVERVGAGRRLSQLHLGGGTPNYLSEMQLVRLMSIVERHFVVDERTETSLEASPKRSSATQLHLLRGLGFKHVTFEVRDMDPTVQMALGRSNSMPMMEDVFGNARDAGIETLSLDLVYGLPSQTIASIEATLENILALEPDRIACYAYTRKPEAFKHQRAIDSFTLPSLADRLIMFNAIVNVMEAANYTWVGLDCFSRKDDGLAIAQGEHTLHRNWIGYNLHGSPNLLGFGASAISETGGVCVQNHLQIPDWQAAIKNGILPIRGGVTLNEAEQAQRLAVSGLLCNMELGDYASLMGIEDDEGGIKRLQDEGVVTLDQGKIVVTPEGRHLLHHLCGDSLQEYRWASGW